MARHNVKWALGRSASDVYLEQKGDRVQVELIVETQTSADAVLAVESLLRAADVRAPVGGGSWLVIGVAPHGGPGGWLN